MRHLARLSTAAALAAALAFTGLPAYAAEEVNTPAPTPTVEPPAEPTPAPTPTPKPAPTPTPEPSTPKATTFKMPLKAKVYTITSWQGARCMPLPGGQTSHSGMDMAAAGGTPIYAVAAGVVTETRNGTSKVNGAISIRHNVDGVTYVTRYVHMWNAKTHAKVGQKVKAGQRISQVGTSGSSTGNHLHLELWKATASGGLVTTLDPRPWLKKHGIDLVKNARSVTAKTTPSKCVYYTTGKANLRKGPSTSTTALVKLAKGTIVSAVPGSAPNGFIPVKAGTRSGYIANYLLTPKKPAKVVPAPATTGKKKTVMYKTTAALHLRPTASTKRKPLLTIPKGQNIGKVYATKGKWKKVKVTIKGKTRTGWVHSGYIKKR